MSEIDDIFASKAASKKESKKDPSSSDKKRKRHPPVDTVPDTSASKRPKISKKSATKKDKEDDEKFKDSRGTGPRRKTEEGWSIYKVDELGIDEEAGGTPLCPFDCNCCF